MEPLRLKTPRPVDNEIENWDDDEDLVIEGDELFFRSSVSTTTGPSSSQPASRPPSRRRDSTSSHMSFRSEIDSLGSEEKQFHLPGDDEASTMDAIAAAEYIGVPLPRNVPSSALIGGTIRRLGGRKIKKIIQEDWEHDLKFPDDNLALNLKPKSNADFPETLRQVSGSSITSSPTRSTTSAASLPQSTPSVRPGTSVLASALSLEKFKETDDDDDFLGKGDATIKASRGRAAPHPVSYITPPTPQKKPQKEIQDVEDDFEQDLELPSDGQLRLSIKKEILKTPSSSTDDLDWGEGSLGTRYGGTRRDGRSSSASNVSNASPSISSSMTAESEDENLDGIVLPCGPFNFRERLQQRKKSISPERIPEEAVSPKSVPPANRPARAEADRDDFFDGLDIGDGNVFGPGRLTLHRNIKLKQRQPTSPARPKAAVSLTFTNKPVATQTRISRLSHERAHSTSLEPVYESGGSSAPWRNSRRHSQSRTGHSHQSSVASLPTPTTTTITSPGRQFPPSAPRNRSSFSSLKSEASTTSSQLLRQKRSLPAVRGWNPQAKPMAHSAYRPPSRTETGRPRSGSRPKTPVERQRSGLADSPASLARKPQPFLPSGAPQSKTQQVASKTMRQFRRHDSDNSIDIRTVSRPYSRSGARSPSPRRHRGSSDTWERPNRLPRLYKKHFGDGSELDGFDDLPTSREFENRFLKQPVAGGAKATIRSRLHQHNLPDRTVTPAPFSPLKATATPHFARDTAASRIARETSLAHRAPSHGPLATLSAQREGPLGNKSNIHPQPHLPQSTVRSVKRKTKRPQQLKPHLITNLNLEKNSRVYEGMFYNAETQRWEGNENALHGFDAAVTTPTPSAATHFSREKDLITPRPALITNFGATKGVQVVHGGMVFDPESMSWQKMDVRGKRPSTVSEDADAFEDEGDVFKDIPDLDDVPAEEERRPGGRVSDIKDDWLVGEEFDVGPEFVKRQREEEERWRRKCEKWVANGPRDGEMWRWTIRDLVSQFDDLRM